MDYVIAFKGEAQTKVVLTDGVLARQLVRPFVGARCNGTTEVGIGFLNTDGQVQQFYAPDFFKNILQSWRGLRIFDRLTHIWKTTLQDCYNAAAPDPTYLEKRAFECLADQIGRRQLDIFLDKIRILVPAPGVLDQMLTIFDTSGVTLDVFELQSELKKGRLQSTLFLRFLINQEVQAYKQLNSEERAQYESEIRRMEQEAGRLITLQARAVAS
ncbi:hypothetical protein KJ611_03540 [Patescibacteria group bacterium]|nr:hypothetical protein [Patescibacteria group bacterium]